MTPEQLATLAALAGIIKTIGTWPIMSIFVLMALGPWLVNAYTSYQGQRRFEQLQADNQKRFESVVKMYENNVTLLTNTQDLGKGLREQLVWSTQTVAEANEIAKNNLFCPTFRKGAKMKDIQS